MRVLLFIVLVSALVAVEAQNRGRFRQARQRQRQRTQPIRPNDAYGPPLTTTTTTTTVRPTRPPPPPPTRRTTPRRTTTRPTRRTTPPTRRTTPPTRRTPPPTRRTTPRRPPTRPPPPPESYGPPTTTTTTKRPTGSIVKPQLTEMELEKLLWDLRESIPGEPGVDYPTFYRIPETSFSCQGRIPGFYADIDAGCQAFHVCSDNAFDAPSIQHDFLCPNGSIFNQELFVCDWWGNVNCPQSESFYRLNEEIGKIPASASQNRETVVRQDASRPRPVVNDIPVHVVEDPEIIPIRTRPQPVRPRPLTQPVRPRPLTQPVRPRPLTQPVRPRPLTQPVRPRPLTQPVRPRPLTQPVRPRPEIQPIDNQYGAPPIDTYGAPSL